jgi:hypothetical protein
MMDYETVKQAFYGVSIQGALELLLKMDTDTLLQADLPKGVQGLFQVTPGSDRVVSLQAVQIRVFVLRLILQEGGIDLKYMMMPRGLNRKFPEDDVTD